MTRIMAATLICCVTCLQPACAATYKLVPFKVGDVKNVLVTGINSHGVAVGTYVSRAKPFGAGFVGVLGSTFTLPKVETSILKDLGIPQPSGINDSGAVIGTYWYGNPYVFVWQNDRYIAKGLGLGETIEPGQLPPFIATGDRLTFNVGEGDGIVLPYAGTPTQQTEVTASGFPQVSSTNASLQVTGQYVTFLGSNPAAAVFLGTTSQVQPLFPPKATSSFGGWINDAGQVAGSYATKAAMRIFIYKDGHYRTFPLPTGATTVATQGIDKIGRVVGVYGDPAGQHAFILAHGTVEELAVFPAGDTVHVAISRAGSSIAIADTSVAGESQSFLAVCSGTGC